MKTIYTVFLLLLLLSCTSSSEKLAWEIANNSQTNKKELTRFLEHYKTNKDKDKYKAACFLIENMPNKYSINGKEQKIYDIDIVKADSLIKSLEHSFFLKEKHDNGQSDLIISLYDYEDGQWIRSKTINPNERLELFYSFEAIPANNVTRARLFLSTYFRDRKTGKLVSKRYKNDLPIKQIK